MKLFRILLSLASMLGLFIEDEGDDEKLCQLSSMLTDNNKNKNFNDFCPIGTKNTSNLANQHEFECVKTGTKGYVHMKTCSSNGIDSTIRGYCQDTHPVNSSLWLTVPVTKNGTTFKNIFCLMCQNEKPTDWSFWELGFSCFDQSTGLAAKILERSANFSAFKPYEAGFWTYTEAEKKYTCFLHPEVPTNSNYSRCCQVPNTENTCSSHDSHVYADCVIQPNHNVSKNDLCNPMPTKMNMTFKVKLTKEMIPSFPHCDRILENITSYINICTLNTTTSNWPPTKCPFNKFFQVNSSESSKYEYLKDDWLYMSNTTIYICKAPESCQLSLPFNSSMLTGTNKNENFDDFCPNGISISNNTLQHEFECVKTATNGYVHMKTCSSNGIDSTIRGYCQDTHPINSSLWLTVPVTKNGTTFKNIFCLMCQNEKPTDWSFWELGFSCFDQSTGLAAKILERSADFSAFKPYEAGFWTYTEAEKKYTCFLHPEVPTNSNYSRCCQVPNTENTCSSHDSHVYADCVIQPNHNVSKNDLCNPMPTKMNMTFKVKLTKEMIPSFPPWDRILENITSYINICTLNTTTSNWPPTKCPFNKFFQVNSSESSKYEYLKDDWLYMSNTTIYICKVPESCQLSLPFNSSMLTGTNKNENFDDFCPNGISISNNTLQHEFECVKTATNGYVHMKTCSSNGIDSTIRGYCQDTHPINSSLWLTVPVTKNGTTFKNIFCLMCQNEKPTDWSFWELGFSCFDQSTGLAAKILERSADFSAFKPYEAGFWTYTEAEKKYTCFLHPEVPTNSNYSRCCQVPNKEKAQDTCLSHDSHVYANCVIQSNHSVSESDSCNPMFTEMNMSFKVKLKKDMIPSFPHCDRIPKNTSSYNITCTPNTATSYQPLAKCPFNKFFQVKSFKPSKYEYLNDDWFYMNNTIYICSKGHENPPPTPSSSLLSTLAYISLIASFGGLILYLLIFSLLPDKNLWDKCLAVFCIMLLIQVLCVISGASHSLLGSEVWHYTLLGCLTWILILCYDYQTSIYKTSGVNLSNDGCANQKFKRYWITSCVLPLVLFILSSYWQNSGPSSKATVHDRLLQESPLGYYWFLAFLLCLASCSFLGRIGYLVFVDTQLSYTIRSLNMPDKVIVAMVAIWMVGSLMMLCDLMSMSDATLYIWHLLQAASFLIFSYKQAASRIKRELGMIESARNAGPPFRHLHNEERAPVVSMMQL